MKRLKNEVWKNACKMISEDETSSFLNQFVKKRQYNSFWTDTSLSTSSLFLGDATRPKPMHRSVVQLIRLITLSEDSGVHQPLPYQLTTYFSPLSPILRTPGREPICNFCKKVGRIARVCRSSTKPQLLLQKLQPTTATGKPSKLRQSDYHKPAI